MYYCICLGFMDTTETASRLQSSPDSKSPPQNAPLTDKHSSVEQDQYSIRKHKSARHSSQGSVSSHRTRSSSTDELREQPIEAGSGRSGIQLTGSEVTGQEKHRSSPSPHVSHTHRKQRVSHTHVPQAKSGDKQEEEAGGRFNVALLQQDVVGEDIARQKLQEVIQERDDLRQNQERVNALWNGRVKRLEAQLERARAGSSLADVRSSVDMHP